MGSLNGFSLLFILVFLGIKIFEQILDKINIDYMKQTAAKLPESLRTHFPEEKVRESIAYQTAQFRFNLVSESFSSLAMLLFIFAGGLNWLHQIIVPLNLGDILSGIVLFLSLLVLTTLLEIPFSYYHTFTIEERFGFNKTNRKTFVGDIFKKFFVAAMLISLLGGLLIKLMLIFPNGWWILGFAVLSGFTLLLMWIYPVLIAPLFNTFSPLEDGELKQEIEAYSAGVNFRLKGIFLMDASKRSGHSNAYFTGLGSAKRVVLYDTLLKNLTNPEIMAVLAHEIGHYKKKHILKMILLQTLLHFVTFLIIFLLSRWAGFYAAFLITQPSSAMTLLLAGLVIPLLFFPLTPMINFFSRRNEYEADRYSVMTYKNPQANILLLIKLTKENLSTIIPHPFYSFFHYSHPSLLERIRFIESLGTI